MAAQSISVSEQAVITELGHAFYQLNVKLEYMEEMVQPAYSALTGLLIGLRDQIDPNAAVTLPMSHAHQQLDLIINVMAHMEGDLLQRIQDLHEVTQANTYRCLDIEKQPAQEV